LPWNTRNSQGIKAIEIGIKAIEIGIKALPWMLW
jgi:hypothetical protein